MLCEACGWLIISHSWHLKKEIIPCNENQKRTISNLSCFHCQEIPLQMTKTKFWCKSDEIGPPLSLKLDKGRAPSKALSINTTPYAMVTMFSPDGSKPRLMYWQLYLFLLNDTIFWLTPCTHVQPRALFVENSWGFVYEIGICFASHWFRKKKWREIF